MYAYRPEAQTQEPVSGRKFAAFAVYKGKGALCLKVRAVSPKLHCQGLSTILGRVMFIYIATPHHAYCLLEARSLRSSANTCTLTVLMSRSPEIAVIGRSCGILDAHTNLLLVRSGISSPNQCVLSEVINSFIRRENCWTGVWRFTKALHKASIRSQECRPQMQWKAYRTISPQGHPRQQSMSPLSTNLGFENCLNSEVPKSRNPS